MIVEGGDHNGRYEISIQYCGMNTGYYSLNIRHPRSGYCVLSIVGTREMIADAVRAWVLANE